jgi:hypothetical protein
MGWGYSRVKPKNTGLPPRGLTIGNRALKMSRILLATSKGSSGEESIAEARLLPVFW